MFLRMMVVIWERIKVNKDKSMIIILIEGTIFNGLKKKK